MSWESQYLALLSASLVRPVVLAAAAALILRVFRVRHPASRHAVWSVVLAGMLVVPLVSVLAPHWRLLPLPPEQHGFSASVPEPLPTLSHTSSVVSEPRSGRQPRSSFSMPPIRMLLPWCYLAGLLAIMLYRAMGWAMLLRVLYRSTPLKGRALRESGDVVSPAAVGVLRPVVLLPIGWRDWNPNTRRAVLAHEFAHIRRKDALISTLGRLVTWVLWFHPLAWWVSRKVSGLAELACDAVVVERMGDPAGYSRILLDFADRVNRAGSRVALPGLAMAASSSGMGKRIDQVFELAGGNTRKLVWPGTWLVLAGLPVACLAATVGLGESNSRPVASQLAPAIVFPKAPPAQVAGPMAGPVIAQASPAPVRPQPPISVRPNSVPEAPAAPMVMLHVSVVDRSGTFLDGLQQSAFRVFENNVGQQVTVLREEEVPLSMGLVLDDSGSMRDQRATLTAAARALLNLSDPQDEMFIVSFNDRAYVEQNWTNDETMLAAWIDRLGARGGSSLRDAVSLSLEKIRSGGKNETKVVFLITDGDDNTSEISRFELDRQARQSGVPIYCIRLSRDPGAYVNVRANQSSLNTLPEASGGQSYYPKDSSEADRIAAQMMRNVRRQYALGYLPADPALDVASRHIRVEVNRPDLIIRLR
jgi:Ca-activated chloride channel homolog